MLISDVLRGKGGEVVTVQSGEAVKAVVAVLAARRIGAVVVMADRRPTGIFSERDLVAATAKLGAAVLDRPVCEVMTSPIVIGHLDDRIEAALQLMTLRRLRHLPVLDQDNLVGLVSLGDLVKHRLEEKEMEANVMLDLARMRS